MSDRRPEVIDVEWQDVTPARKRRQRKPKPSPPRAWPSWAVALGFTVSIYATLMGMMVLTEGWSVFSDANLHALSLLFGATFGARAL